ncbi:bifunctional tRNA (5-methylaminomethyl-2-thiouridine)(34)-methyltransferase MnmD/FAD-dependent 5-carboxymethylaminomethyl-2-thiouridine(34) oxidoreductase MnmC [Alteromonas sp. KUL49]|uniref:bifunctional tRNA (5-methylaminomethyl-2-thiouridine)(34)-methyltransferase MnmD/FAD-dependent 5-carboxymethylaminomethyl-2-thiouridine(34) oxidoreductase MnmC n=1 Tax=Alteromonas sp. KUL49 TaxID=2480798 RepID=UPI00102EE638|nr:bifunctional tRNA (5-methylaminomethyl-2-thiouridine)(34)-methyltransferase MnmD/FAD-dependent 5-carboxymethylaminomethyl-2-thiouridine(34) oxidoreductase MnmC [Alteromonas sp. KUL49]TAP35455.1 bifunctional tRNA (5-methylaminomethyl-2-thiouridine)(34)-methyltransferase MnmD/FAD-dependent 5-carboxymethylaminomethyl-2-thiouridine(34) oxidoreductase MnmC [Alteromonas sp. KUL49]GEA13326.1 tRNA 5-methylaminomethyl-2-thiouridine biosynthesis bifunctional protein MnmC [Alteromonas sp. KUL49]
MKSEQAKVHFNDSGTPVADHFDDVYFSNDSGIDETQHVFVAGNDLHERWESWTQATFIIAETGFGTGLNFLVAMAEFTKFKQQHPNHPLRSLHFLSTEKFPLSQHDMAKALEAFPALQAEASCLSALYPISLQGCHRLEFPTFDTRLDLWFGDVHQLLPQWSSPEYGLVDAWFLDGFAPSKNPEMWTDALFSEMTRLSKEGTTFGTFTAAGIVKRGLAAAGFTIKKRNGFGRKRDMLTGTLDKKPSALVQGPLQRYANSALKPNDHVVVVGSGLAAANTVLSLAKRGIDVTLCYDQDELATGASGNPQGGFYPQLHAQASISSRIQAHGFLYARRQYDHIIANDGDLAHDFCSVVLLGFNNNAQERIEKLASQNVWPTELACLLESNEVTEKAGIPLPFKGLLIEHGGWLSPPDLVRATIELAKSIAKVTECSGYVYQDHIEEDSQVSVTFSVKQQNKETTIQASHLVLATGAQSVSQQAFASLPLRPVRGQVEAIPTQTPLNQLNTVLCHKGYLTPTLNGRHALGSTYVKNDMATDVRTEESEANLCTHELAMASAAFGSALKHDGKARAAIRLGVPDHQPLVGNLHNFDDIKPMYSDLNRGKPLSTTPILPNARVSTLTCLGSRGLTTGPLMAETLVSELCHEPLPLDEDLSQAVNPARFMVKACIRGE